MRNLQFYTNPPPGDGYRQLLCEGNMLMSNDYSVNGILGEQPNKTSSSKFLVYLLPHTDYNILTGRFSAS